jgi:WD40 repeat protein
MSDIGAEVVRGADAAADLEEQTYLLRHWPSDLADQGEQELLHEILTSFTFLHDKLVEFGPQALIEDCALSDDQEVGAIRLCLGQAAHFLVHEPEVVTAHLHNALYLRWGDDSPVQRLLRQAREALAERNQSWLRLLNRPMVSLGRGALRRILDHGASVSTICWSPDGQALVSAGKDHQLLLWYLDADQPRPLPQGHADEVNELAWSPDGTILASGADDHTVLLWDAKKWYPKLVCEGHLDAVRELSWQPRGRLLASTSAHEHYEVRVWDASDGGCRAVLPEAKGPIAWSPDGRLLAALPAQSGDPIQVWDAYNGRRRAVPADCQAPLAWAPDGEVLAAAGTQRRIWLWNSRTDAVRSLEETHTEEVSALAWSLTLDQAGPVLASGSKDGILRLWDAEMGVARAVMVGHWDDPPPEVGYQGMSRTHPLTGRWTNRTTKAEIERLVWSPTGALLASVGADATVRLWETALGGSDRTPKEPTAVLRELRSPQVRWSPDGAMLAADSDNAVRLWDVASGAAADLAGHTDRIRSVGWSPDGTMLASCSADGTTRIWDPAAVEAGRSAAGPAGSVQGRALSPNGVHFATSGSDGTVNLWAITGRLVATLRPSRPRGGPSVHLAWSPGRDLLAAARSSAFRLHVWDVRRGELRHRFDGHSDLVMALAWSPDGRILASGSQDQTVRLWSTVTPDRPLTLEGHTGHVQALAWSPDGRMLASGGTDHTVRLWDTSTGEMKSTLEIFANSVKQLAWSPDGIRLAVAKVEESDPGGLAAWGYAVGLSTSAVREEQKRVEVWHAATGERLAVLAGATYPLAWSPEGTLLTSRCYSDTIVLWDAVTGLPAQVLGGRLYPLDKGRSVRRSGGREPPMPGRGGARDGRWLTFHSKVDRENRLALIWSADGVFLAAAGRGASLQLWNAKTGHVVAATHCLSPVRNLQFTANDHELLAVDDGSATDDHPVAYRFELSNVAIGSPSTDHPLSSWWRRRMRLRARHAANQLPPQPKPAHAQGGSAQVDALCQRLLPMLLDTFGPDHPDVRSAMADLAAAYEAEEDYGQAETVWKRSVAVAEETGSSSEALAEALRGLARLYHDSLSRYDQAEPLYERAAEIMTAKSDPDTLEVAELLHRLGIVRLFQGKHTEAELPLRRAVAILDKTPEATPQMLAVSLHALACTCAVAGKRGEAEPLFRRALSVVESANGLDHPSKATITRDMETLLGLDDDEEDEDHA